MMTDEQKAKAAELRAAILSTSTTREGAPPEVRATAVGLKEELRRAGISARVLSDALGIHESTLCRWVRDPGVRREPMAAKKGRGREAGFRRVQIATAPTPTVAPKSGGGPMTPARGLRVAHAPSGVVIDGLDVETLAQLLRRMS